MFGNALLYVALLAVACATFLSAGLAMTRVTIHRQAENYLTAGYQRAMWSVQQTLATDLQNGPLSSPLPTIAPIPAACVDSSHPCRYETSETIAFTQLSTPAPVATCDARTNCAVGEQANAYVDEGRITARISVTVTSADGSALAVRTDDAIFRTMRTPPFVVLAGTRDGSFGDIAGAHAAGDDGGSLASTPADPCATPVPGTSDDTQVRVAYRNTSTGACSNGSSWRTSSYDSSQSAPAGWSP